MRRLWISALAAAGASLVLVPSWAWAQMPADGDRYGYGHHMVWGFGMILGPLFFILVLALVIAVAVVLVRWLAGPGHVAAQQMQARAPLDILKERFARGEIDKDEFDERRRVLGD